MRIEKWPPDDPVKMKGRDWIFLAIAIFVLLYLTYHLVIFHTR